ncbi:unnamed protein product [Clonostachys chloroleuca]|uniref:Beta-xylosidase C-terminal Concanavalin A-like domain-containing protein n=1 Tax=Clonostachys chloroleuca TaxID=1926264 RepID=A0AA35Q331_9HYPO|nr:unnamed protein product [Clonostachys chloroleuca]
MKISSLAQALLSSLCLGTALADQLANSTYYNPILPGWHSDPSCIRVDETYFCVTSTFIAFPGLPIYASKDLRNWRLISHGWSRESQLPGISWNTYGQQDGMYAATLRYHEGEFFLICEYLGQEDGIIGVLFRTTDPFSDDAWSDPVTFKPTKIDPDIFWDDDGKVYVATQGIILQELNLETGELSQPPISLWNGTGGVWPEGPHIYKRDGWYYLLIAEGGTALDHSVTIARAKSIEGPYEAYANNPILTNRGTDEYFQTVGHGDLFTDTEGNWWGVALATRCGPEYKNYPMGRETVLYPARWEEGEWPVLQNVRGEMEGWPLPAEDKSVPGDGPLNDEADDFDFDASSKLPKHFLHWRVPRDGVFSFTDKGLQIVPSRNNLTGVPYSETDVVLTGRRGLSFVGRRQTHTLFDLTVDLDFTPREIGQEAGITIFLTQANHIDVSVVLLRGDDGDKTPKLSLRLRAEGTGGPPPEKIVAVPEDWLKRPGPIRLRIQAKDPLSYELSASKRCSGTPDIVLGTASSGLVSGGNGSFVGSLVGAFATCNGVGEGADCPAGGLASFKRWRYTPVAQFISADKSVPSS